MFAACGSGDDDTTTTSTTTSGDAAPTTTTAGATSTITEAPGTTTGGATTSSTTSTSSTTTSGTTTSTTSPPTVGELRTEDFATDGFPGTGETALLQQVRREIWLTYVRLVFEFQSELPEYEIAYEFGSITEDGSGNEVDIAGDQFLTVTMAPASGVDLSTEEPVETYTGPERLSIEAGRITEMVQTGDFEAVMSWAVGIDETETVPYSVATLPSPPRLVIDLHTDDIQTAGPGVTVASHDTGERIFTVDAYRSEAGVARSDTASSPPGAWTCWWGPSTKGPSPTPT